ncbi:transposase domain-containing protein [Glycomyces tenuis]|uniref:transposase domain-containing protein n=1 Tax=Glycomyces tenuis TaxID=58116 RepID=UPI003CCBDD6D
MVDAVLDQCRAHQRRLRSLPSRVVVYLLLAAGLFASIGWPGVWQKLCGGIGVVTAPAASALWEARTRVGPAPLKALFGLLAGPTAGTARWRGLEVCAIDGTLLDIPAAEDNRSLHRSSGATKWAGAGYPQVRLVALVAAGSRAMLAAAFGPVDRGETKYAAHLLAAMRTGRLILADRGFDAAWLIAAIHDTGAEMLVRMNTKTKPAGDLVAPGPLPSHPHRHSRCRARRERHRASGQFHHRPGDRPRPAHPRRRHRRRRTDRSQRRDRAAGPGTPAARPPTQKSATRGQTRDLEIPRPQEPHRPQNLQGHPRHHRLRRPSTERHCA